LLLLIALTYASCSSDTKHVQEMLIELSYSCGPTINDGCTGPSTTDAIKKFQKDYGLSVDGIAGPATTSKLEDLTHNGDGIYSEENKHIQEMLIQLSYSCGSSGADGWYGPSTLEAVAAFQKDNSLTVDGIAGTQTVNKLEEKTNGGTTTSGGSPDITPVGGEVTSENKDSSPHPPCDSQNRCYEEVYYNQCDSRWKNTMYSDRHDSSHTMCTSGCGPTSMAMVVATIKDRSITPEQPAAYAVDHGLKDDDSGTYWSFFCSYAKSIGISCEQVDCGSKMSYVKSKIDDGYLGVASMGPGQWTSAGHYIAINSIDGNYIWAHDPNYKSGKSSSQSISQFQKECRQVWLFHN